MITTLWCRLRSPNIVLRAIRLSCGQRVPDHARAHRERICRRSTNGIRIARSIFSAHGPAATRSIASALRRIILESTCFVWRISIQPRCRCARPRESGCRLWIRTRGGNGRGLAKSANAEQSRRQAHKQKRRLPKETAFSIRTSKEEDFLSLAGLAATYSPRA